MKDSTRIYDGYVIFSPYLFNKIPSIQLFINITMMLTHILIYEYICVDVYIYIYRSALHIYLYICYHEPTHTHTYIYIYIYIWLYI